MFDSVVIYYKEKLDVSHWRGVNSEKMVFELLSTVLNKFLMLCFTLFWFQMNINMF